MSTLFMAPVAYAHTMDKSTLYADVPETAPMIKEIMVLHSIGLLGYNGKDVNLNPKENLSRQDFAGWVGGFLGLKGATVNELAQAAKNEDYVSSLEGDITYKEINTTLFHHKLELEKPDATLTKEEYISFLTDHLDADMGGHTLIQMGGFSEGPTGTIEDVVTGDETGVIINGTTYMLSGHPRIFADSTDAKSWVGQTVEKSIFTTGGSHQHGHDQSGDHHEEKSADTPTLQYIQISSPTQASNKTQIQSENATPIDQQQSTKETNESSSNMVWVVALLVLVAVILGFVFVKRKK